MFNGDPAPRSVGFRPHVRSLTKDHAMKAYGGVEVQLRAFLALAIDGEGWSALPLGKDAIQ
jgi:hypothetical protein